MLDETEKLMLLIEKIKIGLIARSQGDYKAYPEYSQDREELIANELIKDHIPTFIGKSSSLDIAFGYMREHASGNGSWEKRRKYVHDEFEPLIQFLKESKFTLPLLCDSDIEQLDIPTVIENLKRAKHLISSDPASAITKSCTILADVCKYIIRSAGNSTNKTDTLPALVKRTARDILKLEGDLNVPSFSGITNQASLISEIRNRYGDAHPNPKPNDYLAEFAVMAAANLAILFLKRYHQKPNNSKVKT